MKKTFTTIALATVLTFGATFANAHTGIIMSDRTANTTGTCSEKDGIIYGGREGIIYGGRGIAGIFADVLNELEGIIYGGKTSTPCSEKDGIIYGGRDGIIYGG